ncbi:MAG TPA: hypothetical protein VII11_05880 [Bacteroidota bacterium]
MKKYISLLSLATMAVVMLTGLFTACSEDEATEASSASSICFSVDGFNVTVRNLWSGGGSYSTNVQGLAAFSETVSQNNETHSLQWTNIQNNYTTYTVTSFNVKIDGKDYSYPANRCN